MYVGPWQEYAIAKTRKKKDETKSKLANKFKEDLEAAIINSLDPVSAARAMKAMEKVIKKSDVPFAVNDSEGMNKSKRRRPKILPGQHNLAAYKLQLPSVSPNSVDDGKGGERRNSLAANSARTSASEPTNSQRRSSFSPRANARKNVQVGMQDEDDDDLDRDDEGSIMSHHSHISSISISKGNSFSANEEMIGQNDGGSSRHGVSPRYKSLGDHMNQLEEEGRYNQTLPEGNKDWGQSVHEIVRKLR